MSLSKHYWQILRDEFDAGYYLAFNPDVAEAGLDPVEHYHLYGWREGRNPSPNFDTEYYLRQYPDVRAAGINPLLHYCLHGRSEGRSARAPVGEADNAAREFDREFYLQQNPDVAEAGVDAFWHFSTIGWREGRNPSADFDVNYYLAANADVREADINPLIHYVQAGRVEGRLPRRPLADQRDQLEQVRAARRQAQLFIYPAAISQTHLFRLENVIGSRNLVVSISHDNYLENFGGVQNVISDEERDFRQEGWDYLHLAPIIHHTGLIDYEAYDRYCVSIQLNGVSLAVLPLRNIIETMSSISGQVVVQVIVHHLMGHMPEMIQELVVATKSAHPVFWCHDFFAACPSYTLLRNGINYCGAPAIISNACTICSFGPERKRHVERMTQLLTALPWRIVAPSETALSTFQRAIGVKALDGDVWPIAKLEFDGYRRRPVERAIRVAHLGARQFHKGWGVFRELVAALSADERYAFYQLGLHGGMSLSSMIENIPVLVNRNDPTAMIDAVRDHEIDIAFIWPNWPETFNFVVHEALAGGAFVVTSEQSGNVWPAVKQNAPNQGWAFKELPDVVEAFRNGSIIEQLRRTEPKFGSLKSGHGKVLKLIQSAASVGNA